MIFLVATSHPSSFMSRILMGQYNVRFVPKTDIPTKLKAANNRTQQTVMIENSNLKLEK